MRCWVRELVVEVRPPQRERRRRLLLFSRLQQTVAEQEEQEQRAPQGEQEQRTASGRIVRRADQFHDLPPTAQHNRNLARGRTAQEQANWHLL